ncbi:MAG: GNAT family N-acetyltransferase [Paracoccaceae bacterium]
MQNITIKVLGPDDAPVLAQVRDDVFDNPVIPAQAAAFLASDLHCMVVALDGNQVIGMASAVTMLHPDKEPMVFINEVGVHDDYQCRGVGKKLTELLIKTVNPKSDRDVWLATEEDNTAARALYRSLKARETKGVVVYDWGHAMDD